MSTSEIKAEKYLKPESYYSDLYDRFTVEECRRWEKKGVSEDWTTIKEKDKTKKSKIDKIKKEFTVNVVIPTVLYFIKGDRYAQKAETIREWMEEDRQKEEKLENTEPPKDIFCLSCGSEMTVEMKDLHKDSLEDKEDKVLFFFECPKCKKRRNVWEDGKEWKLRIPCSRCKSEVVKESSKRKGNIITTIYACPNCGYKEKDVLNLDEKPKPEKIDPNFGRDRQRFCLSAEEGNKYIDHQAKAASAAEFLKELGKKEEIREKTANIKKLNIAGLIKTLTPALEKEGYIKLEFSKPEIGRDVIVSFTIQDDKSDRGEYDSIHNLKKILKLTLSNTNWRLMSEGIYYKLGILSGRLRGYENEEDLLKLVK